MEAQRLISNRVLRRIARVSKNFDAIYSHGGHIGHVSLTIYINFHSPFLTMLHIKFGFDVFDWPSGFREEDV